MKATYTLTLLTLTIQAMVNGQTQGNQTRKIREDIFNSKISTFKEKEIQKPAALAVEQEKNQMKTEELMSINNTLKHEINSIQQKYIATQIEMSLLKAQITYEKFNINKLTIQKLITDHFDKPETINRPQTLSSEADATIKIAKEIREEANAQFTAEAKLAEMSNAEEKEFIALSKQQQAIDLLKQHPLILKSVNQEFQVCAPIIPVSSPVLVVASKLSELTKQALSLKNTYLQLREAATFKQGNEQKVLIAEAKTMEKDYIEKQIEILTLNSKLTEQQFCANRAFIENLLDATTNTSIVNQATNINQEAEYNFRLAKEMREEANAQFTQSAKLGEMSNAEEKDVIALSKQHLTILSLEKINTLASN